MQREPGFYWVRMHKDDWEIARWDGSQWADTWAGENAVVDFPIVGEVITPPEEK